MAALDFGLLISFSLGLSFAHPDRSAPAPRPKKPAPQEKPPKRKPRK
jgi:hypothetical protein